jgi:hypothetical protein
VPCRRLFKCPQQLCRWCLFGVGTTWKVGLRGDGLGEDGDIGSVAGTAEANSKADASRSSGDDDGLALEGLFLLGANLAAD